MVAAALEIDDDLPIVRYTISSTPSTGPFAVPFPLPTDYASALKVAIDGVETTDWTFAPDSDVAGGYPTGEVTLTYAQSDCEVTIWRRLPLERTADYANGPLDLAGLNSELAYTIMRLQDTRLRATQVWRTGAGAPADADGLDGDMYINVTNGDLYGPKALGAWGGAVGNLVDDVSAAAIAAAAAAAVTTHVALGDPHTQYLLESAVSANGLTLIGHTFAQMRSDLSLVIGTNVQAWDADLDSWAAVTRSSGFDTFVATPSSANLRSLLTDETGTGAAVFANTPTLVTPNIGAATGTSLTLSGTLSVSGGSPHVFNRSVVPQYIIQLNDNGTLRGYLGADASYFFRVSDAGGTSYFDVSSTAIVVGSPVRLKSYTVAGLPAGAAGDTAYASNGRKNGEGAGAGTGVLVFKDGTAWRACDTGATVAA